MGRGGAREEADSRAQRASVPEDVEPARQECTSSILGSESGPASEPAAPETPAAPPRRVRAAGAGGRAQDSVVEAGPLGVGARLAIRLAGGWVPLRSATGATLVVVVRDDSVWSVRKSKTQRFTPITVRTSSQDLDAVASSWKSSGHLRRAGDHMHTHPQATSHSLSDTRTHTHTHTRTRTRTHAQTRTNTART